MHDSRLFDEDNTNPGFFDKGGFEVRLKSAAEALSCASTPGVKATVTQDDKGRATSVVKVMERESYFDLHLRDGTWATDVELKAITRVLDKTVHVVKRGTYWSGEVQSCPARNGCTKYIYVEWDGDHYTPWCMPNGSVPVESAHQVVPPGTGAQLPSF